MLNTNSYTNLNFKRMKWNDPRLRFADMGRSSTMLTIHPELLHKDAFHI